MTSHENELINNLMDEVVINFKIKESKLISLLLRNKREQLRSIESLSQSKISIDDKYVKISSTLASNTLRAQELVIQFIRDRCIELNVPKKFAKEITKVGCGKIHQTIIHATDADMKIEDDRNVPKDQKYRKIRIIGTIDDVQKLRKIIVGQLYTFLTEQFNEEKRSREYRSHTIRKGLYHDVTYTTDQIRASPQLFFLTFQIVLQSNEKAFTPFDARTEIVPPGLLNKNGAVAAPFQGFYYRAKVLGLHLSEDLMDIRVKVIFIDFGNIEEVSFFECNNLDKEFLYPGNATACQISQIVAEKYSRSTIKCFTERMKTSPHTIEVHVNKDYDSNELVKVDVLNAYGNIKEYLVEYTKIRDLMKEFSFEPDHLNTGQIPIVYSYNHAGGATDLFVFTCIRKMGIDFELSGNLKTKVLESTCTDAYEYAEKYLKDTKNKLKENTYVLDVRPAMQLEGTSMTAAMTIAFVSVALNMPVQSGFAITGDMDKEGNILPVEHVREKLLAAENMGKLKLYCPIDNSVEAQSLKTDVQIIPFKHITTVLNEMFEKGST